MNNENQYQSNTKFCTNCGAQISKEAYVCTNCGVLTNNKAAQPAKKSNGMGFGIGSLFAWLIPLVGYPISIIGIVKASKALKNGEPGATTALVLSIIGLVLTVINSAIGAYMGATGSY